MDKIIEQRDEIISRANPVEIQQFIIESGGDAPPDTTDWQVVINAARMCINTFPEYDEDYRFDTLDYPEYRATCDLIFPRKHIDELLKRHHGRLRQRARRGD